MNKNPGSRKRKQSLSFKRNCLKSPTGEEDSITNEIYEIISKYFIKFQ